MVNQHIEKLDNESITTIECTTTSNEFITMKIIQDTIGRLPENHLQELLTNCKE